MKIQIEVDENPKLLMMHGEKCDKYDYLIAAFCGCAAGLIDVFFVGDPTSSKLGGAVDNTADELVKKAAQLFWKHDKREAGRSKEMPQTLEKCISYLEQAFPVPYDARYGGDLADDSVLPNMRPANHHLLSLAHSPDPIGLIFSIIDQFNGYGTFVDHGKLIHVYPQKQSKAIPYLRGSNFPSKLFCGFVNWIGHLLSDLAGSSSTRKEGKTGRGAGVPIPFYSLLLGCNFGPEDGNTVAEIMVRVFEEGYDARFGAAMAIPLVMEELMIRVLWTVKKHFWEQKPWSECFPSKKHADLRIMLLVGNGTLCVMDGADALIRSGGNVLTFMLRLNMVAWCKLVLAALREIEIQFSFTYEDLRKHIEAINRALDEYIAALKHVDYAGYERELADLRQINRQLEDGTLDTALLYTRLEQMGANMQFHSFDEFDQKMQDKTFVLKI